MKDKKNILIIMAGYWIVICIILISATAGSKVITVLTESAQLNNRKCIIIDAGHGGVDGGATSCTGILESNMNLEIALCLDDLMHLLGMETKMIRTTDISVYTEGESIAAKKVSDLKNRVKIVQNTQNAIFLSIHQNQFPDSQYSGPQVFYAPTEKSDLLAKKMQSSLIAALAPNCKRQAKKADGIYLMQNIQCPGILIECGFISNPVEEAKLRDTEYQKQLCCVIASAISVFMHSNTVA